MKGPKRKATPGSEPPAADALELPERWSAPRKTELILRLLRGEALDAVSRESQVPAHELESWKRVFLDQGTRGLRIRGEPEERELTLARAKIGELMMRLELAEDLIEKRGSGSIWVECFSGLAYGMLSRGSHADFGTARGESCSSRNRATGSRSLRTIIDYISDLPVKATPEEIDRGASGDPLLLAE
jgi:transposase